MLANLQSHSMMTLAQGFLLCASLIIVIGPQNMFLLQQGLRRRHLLVTALLCTLFDLILITLGIGGVGAAIAADERLLTATTLGGTAFLLGYGIRSFRSAWCMQPVAAHNSTRQTALSLRGTVLATMSFTFLNPGAYLDTVLMIGAASTRFPQNERLIFGVGAVAASGLWFFILTYGASRLGFLLRAPSAWRTLDVISGCFMVAIAAYLCINQSFLFW
jgi:L-lysine exporter family protein LysE/ArgO